MKSALYEGWVRHRRVGKPGHEFKYRLFQSWIDLAELPRLFKDRWLWSVEQRNVVSFRREDYLHPSDVPLDTAVRDLVETRLAHRPAGPIRLLTNLRAFGLAFNPVSFYYCYDAADESVEAIVADITNTPWGERHAYVLDRRAQPSRTSRHVFPKSFHVSPFVDMDVECDWRFTEPGDRLAVHMVNRKEGKRTFDASLSLKRRELDARSMSACLLRHPFMTAEVMLGIYWQAMRLLLKGARFHPHPGGSAASLSETRT